MRFQRRFGRRATTPGRAATCAAWGRRLLRNWSRLPPDRAAGCLVPSLEAAGLLHLFDVVVTFDDVGRPKPEPDIFLEAARRSPWNPRVAWCSRTAGKALEAARRAGMRSVDVVTILQDGAATKQKPRQIIGAVLKGGRQSKKSAWAH